MTVLTIAISNGEFTLLPQIWQY